MQTIRRFIPLLTLPICLLFSISSSFASPRKATQIINIRPQLPAGPERLGYCSSKSKIVNQPGAWRCAVDHHIYDPCFTTAKPRVLLCNAKSQQRNSGFKLRLQQSLPSERLAGKKRSLPWMIKLADNSLCKLHITSVLMIKQQPIWYGCDSVTKNSNTRVGILGYPKLAKVWSAQKVMYIFSSTGEVHVKQIKIVPVKTVWQYKP
ncbi:hypothetical protein BH10PSE19_BH10PSE19_07680 [soil metagenome]